MAQGHCSDGDFDSVVLDFKQWRKERFGSRSKIPDELWEKAVGLCAFSSIGKVAAKLGLNHGTLKKRVDSRLHRKTSESVFTELGITKTDRSDECVHGRIEMEYRDREKITIHLSECSEERFVSFIQALRRNS